MSFPLIVKNNQMPTGEGTTTNFSILAWRIPWTEEPGRLQSVGLQSQTGLNDFHFHSHLQKSFREKKRDKNHSKLPTFRKSCMTNVNIRWIDLGRNINYFKIFWILGFSFFFSYLLSYIPFKKHFIEK